MTPVRVLAIADLHLSSDDPKPMDVFGPAWADHPEAVFDGWRRTVRDDDVVLVPGDVSWALKLAGALPDLRDLDALPGRKVLLRGNHDYWWPSLAKLRRALPPSLQALQHDAIRIGGLVVAGTRGWICPGTPEFSEADARIHRREVERLGLSLAAAERIRRPGDRTVVMMHFPPTNPRLDPSGFTERIERFAPDAFVYGHVHGGTPPPGYPFARTRTTFVAADALQFEPALVLDEVPSEPPETIAGSDDGASDGAS